ncbi:mCG146847 [Mus musculus]|nr:mCG146847 [Mus musculus]
MQVHGPLFTLKDTSTGLQAVCHTRASHRVEIKAPQFSPFYIHKPYLGVRSVWVSKSPFMHLVRPQRSLAS